MKKIINGVAALAIATAALAVSTDANAKRFDAKSFFAELEKVMR
jgi:hypothetical protein